MGRASQGMAKRVVQAKVACLDMNLQKARMHMGVQVTALPASTYWSVHCTLASLVIKYTAHKWTLGHVTILLSSGEVPGLHMPVLSQCWFVRCHS